MKYTMTAVACALGVELLGVTPLRAAPVTWGDNTTANTAAGILDATSIPTNGSVTFTNVSGAGYDIVITTNSLNQSSAGGLGTNVHSTWFVEGAAASAQGQSIPYSTVTVRFYATGTTNPFYLTGTDFKFVDAEVDERFKNFGYYGALGELVPFATATDPIGGTYPALSYSGGGPNQHLSDSSVDTGAPNVGGTQTDKWIRLNLSAQAITGFTFQTGRASSNNGSVETTALGDLVHQLQQIDPAGASVASGQSYDGLASTSTLGSAGAGTQVQLLGGTASANKTVTVDFSLTSTSGFQAGPGALSDVVKLTGTNGDKVVLQLSYNDAGVPSEDAVFLGWFNGGTLVNAVDGNTDLPGEANTPLFHLGAYDPAADFHLGYYGVDPVSNVVWAVIDHNSEFTVTSVPEPASTGLLMLGGCALAVHRRRRRA